MILAYTRKGLRNADACQRHHYRARAALSIRCKRGHEEHRVGAGSCERELLLRLPEAVRNGCCMWQGIVSELSGDARMPQVPRKGRPVRWEYASWKVLGDGSVGRCRWALCLLRSDSAGFFGRCFPSRLFVRVRRKAFIFMAKVSTVHVAIACVLALAWGTMQLVFRRGCALNLDTTLRLLRFVDSCEYGWTRACWVSRSGYVGTEFASRAAAVRRVVM